jgi:hypothetical protein
MAHQLTLPEHVRLVFFPPYGPELNPRGGWRDLKDALAWLPFPTLEGQPDDLAMLLRAYERGHAAAPHQRSLSRRGHLRAPSIAKSHNNPKTPRARTYLCFHIVVAPFQDSLHRQGCGFGSDRNIACSL